MPYMPSDFKSQEALLDIRDNILLARAFVTGLTFDEFKQSRLHVYAVIRAVEIISEASRRLSDEIRARHGHLPWRAIRDTGNVYRHEYDNVAEDRVWRTVQTTLTPLLVAIECEIAAFDTSDKP
jgi:uncharacterized protein with HEPN domain